jgi:hypothetical protein
MTRADWGVRLAGAFGALLLAPGLVLAGGELQAPSAKPASSVVVEQVENGAVFGLDAKVTRVDGTTATLIGGFGGVLLDNTVMFGAAGYWRLDGGDQALGYGGALVQWYPVRTGGVAVSLSGLVGGGVARVSWSDGIELMHGWRNGMAETVRYPSGGFYYLTTDQTFFVAEPSVGVLWRLGRGVALQGSVGYRFVGWADGFEDHIRGVTGTVSVRFGGR